MMNKYTLHNKKRSNAGFTIIELTLAMSFVAVLLIAVTILSINIGKIYNRGVTYKELNQTGAAISTDLHRSLSSAWVDKMKYINSGSINRLCLGNYSYVWNKHDSGAPTNTKYNGQAVRLMKVLDGSGKYCKAPYPTVISSTDDPKELLSLQGNRDLYIYDLTITPMSGAAGTLQIPRSSELSTKRGLYTIKVTLGTGEANRIDAANVSCKAPAGVDGGDEYCAINTFTIVVSIGNTQTS